VSDSRAVEIVGGQLDRALGVDRKTICRWGKRESAPAPEQRKRMEKLTQLNWFLENSFRAPAQEDTPVASIHRL